MPEWHPLVPFLPEGCKVLFLGSFPPQRKRWCMDFFYPNFTNEHWRIEGLAFYGDAQHFVDQEHRCFKLKEIVVHLKTYGIGIFDTALAVRRLADNASDKFLEVAVPTDVRTLVEHLPELRAIVTTGEKASETVALALGMTNAKGRAVLPKVGTALPSPIENVDLFRLPSSSRAYPMALTEKAEAYRLMFERYFEL
ncbi:MAG: uracil-DNA glycosylase family protein [Bacteroidaceae bacterium]|nr:uracil-DNA glycosylase family protein [Bacteroidaceae bacterium]